MEKQKEIAEVLQAISDANGGKITPDQVVKHAKDPNSPLHERFIWSDKEAAQKHRLDTARQLIRSVRVIIKKETKVLRAPAYVRDPELDAKEQGYIDVRSSVNDEDSQRDILINEFKRVQGVFERAAELAVLFRMEGQLEAVQRQIKIMVAELSGESGHA